MSVHNAAYSHSLGPGNPTPYRTSDYTSQYDPGPSPSDALVPGSHRSVGQEPHQYHTEDSARTATRHPRNIAGYSNQYPVGNAGDYAPSRDYYHPIAPSLDSRVSEGPIYPAHPYDGYSTGRIQYGQPPGVIAPYGVTGQPLGDYGSQGKRLYESQPPGVIAPYGVTGQPLGDYDSQGKRLYEGQPPGVIAPYGVTGQPLGDYGSQGESLYEGQQSDDDYQRHNADRHRREGRAQDQFGQRNQRTF